MGKNFVSLPRNKDFVAIPAIIFSDDRVSIGAKGLYAQLYHSSSNIDSLEEITELSSSSKEEIDAWFAELNEIGYLVTKKGGACELKIKTQTKETVDKKLDKDAIQEFTEYKREEPKLNAYEKMTMLIKSYKFNPKIENLLIAYFEKWMNKQGRFAEAEDLHGYVVRGRLNDLVSFRMSDDDMIICIQTSIDKEWYKFVDHRLSGPDSYAKSSGFKPFDKSTITSGSYTEDDINELKARAAALEAQGKKGTF